MTLTSTFPWHKPAPKRPSGELEAPILAVPKTLFPTFGSLKEALEFAESKLPITDKNELISLMMSYHNTLLDVTAKKP